MKSQIDRPPKLHELVAARMQEKILFGDWKNHSRLPSERELCVEFGVSRSVIREALKVVATRGLLKETAGKGTFVCQNVVDPLKDLLRLFVARNRTSGYSDLFEVRQLLEVEIAGLAAERATDEDIAKLREIHEAMTQMDLTDASWSKNQAEKYMSLDLSFHMALAEATKNNFFVILLAALAESFKSAWTRMLKKFEPRHHGVQMHAKILKAVCSRDASRARRATRENLRAFLADTRKSDDQGGNSSQAR